MDRSEEINELAAALSKFQGEFRAVAKDAENPYFKSKYADLTAHLEVALPLLSKHGLSLLQMPCGDGQDAAMQTMLMHESGQYISQIDRMKPAKNDAHGIGSADTYLRRYGLSIYGAYADDDDGNKAVEEEDYSKIPAEDILIDFGKYKDMGLTLGEVATRGGHLGKGYIKWGAFNHKNLELRAKFAEVWAKHSDPLDNTYIEEFLQDANDLSEVTALESLLTDEQEENFGEQIAAIKKDLEINNA